MSVSHDKLGVAAEPARLILVVVDVQSITGTLVTVIEGLPAAAKYRPEFASLEKLYDGALFEPLGPLYTSVAWMTAVLIRSREELAVEKLIWLVLAEYIPVLAATWKEGVAPALAAVLITRPLVRVMLPESTWMAFGVVIVQLVPAIGAPLIWREAADVYVMPVLLQLYVRAPRRRSLTCATVPLVAVAESVMVDESMFIVTDWRLLAVETVCASLSVMPSLA